MSTHRCTRPNAEEKKWYSPVPGKQYETRLMLRHPFGSRYNNDPREPHDNAVKQIGCYFKSYLDKGIVFKPDLNNLAINLHVNANFSRFWNLKYRRCQWHQIKNWISFAFCWSSTFVEFYSPIPNCTFEPRIRVPHF